MNQENPMECLCQSLTEEFDRDKRGKGVAALMAAYVESHDDWKRHALFDPSQYARNLVDRTDMFELIVICWQAGQASPIHSHAGQNCWMAILEGSIEEILYRYTENGPGVERLQVESTKVYDQGQVGFINDDIALHLIRPTDGNPGISLHLYSRPIPTCNVYEPATGRVETKQLSYHSINGVLVS